MKILGFIDRLYDKKISSKGLGLFRIFFLLNLLLEVIRIFRYRQLYFDPIPFLKPLSFDYTIPLLLWMLVLLMLVLGLFTRIMSIINYGFILWIVNASSFFEYHMNYTYLGIGFLMMIIPLSQSYSLDNLLKRKKNNFSLKKSQTSVLYYFLIIFFGVVVVYFDSIFYKFKCLTWVNGLGMWLPASLPYVSISSNQWLLNQEFLIKALGYLTFAFELVFPFLFFLKKYRTYLLFIGLGLHFGILLEFPIPFFALGVIAIYILMVPVSFWDKIEKLFISIVKSKYSKINTEDINSTTNERVRLIFNKWNLRKTQLIAFKLLITFFVFLQLNSTFNFPLSNGIINKVTNSFPSSKPFLNDLLEIKGTLRVFSHDFFGITGHGVFVDSHFRGYNRMFNVKYKGELLPMYTETGMPGKYLLGGSWINYTFRVNNSNVLNKQEQLKKGLIRYTAFWAKKNKIVLDNKKFKIIMKKIRVTFEWEKDLLKNNLATPWEEVGTMIWSNNEATIEINNNKIK